MIRKFKSSAPVLAMAFLAAPMAARAATSTGSMPVSMTIQAQCLLQATSTSLQFATTGVIAANVDAQTSLGVQCTNSTPYSIGLDPGQGSGATVGSRLMTGASNATIGYSVYRDAARSQVWGQTANVDAMAATGTGSVQTFNLYGRVPVQTTPAPGAFNDTLAITVTY